MIVTRLLHCTQLENHELLLEPSILKAQYFDGQKHHEHHGSCNMCAGSLISIYMHAHILNRPEICATQ